LGKNVPLLFNQLSLRYDFLFNFSNQKSKLVNPYSQILPSGWRITVTKKQKFFSFH
jgi:hypothetical protein